MILINFSMFGSLFFPDLCIVCNEKINKDSICIACKAKRPFIEFTHIDTHPAMIRFPNFQNIKLVYATFYRYKDGVIDKIVGHFKYKYHPELASEYGEIMANHFVKNISDVMFDYIIPLPIHKFKMNQRGYNQSLLLANGIAQKLQRPVLQDFVTKRYTNKSMTLLGRIDRWINNKEKFFLHKHFDINHKNILLIDDILTTGATLSSCIECIKDQYPKTNISVATLALSMD